MRRGYIQQAACELAIGYGAAQHHSLNRRASHDEHHGGLITLTHKNRRSYNTSHHKQESQNLHEHISCGYHVIRSVRARGVISSVSNMHVARPSFSLSLSL